MLKRVLTSIVALPILAVLIILGGLPLKIAVFVIIAIGMYEVYNALSNKHQTIHYVGYLFAAVYLLFIDNLNNTNVMTNILISFILCILTLLVIFHKKVTVINCAETLFGFYYVAVLMSTIYLVRMSNHGEYLVWIIFISAWGSDTGAYLTGKTFGLGKHKLIPSLSPNKTVEGAIGGVVLATALSLIYGFCIMQFTNSENPIGILIYGVAGVFGGTFSQFGDLAASAIKRYTGIKDFGHILPGHGGIIDRFDSVLFTAPAVFLIIMLMIK